MAVFIELPLQRHFWASSQDILIPSSDSHFRHKAAMARSPIGAFPHKITLLLIFLKRHKLNIAGLNSEQSALLAINSALKILVFWGSDVWRETELSRVLTCLASIVGLPIWAFCLWCTSLKWKGAINKYRIYMGSTKQITLMCLLDLYSYTAGVGKGTLYIVRTFKTVLQCEK